MSCSALSLTEILSLTSYLQTPAVLVSPQVYALPFSELLPRFNCTNLRKSLLETIEANQQVKYSHLLVSCDCVVSRKSKKP